VGGSVTAVPDPAATSSVTSSPALDRIHRLERQERERLERQQRLIDARETKVAGTVPGAGTHRESLARAEHILRFPMAALGLVWAVLGAIALNWGSHSALPRAVVALLFGIWAVVVIECVVRYVVVEDRRGYFTDRRLVEPAMVVLPLFQLVRLAGAERVEVIWNELGEGFVAVLRHRGLFRVLLAATGLLFLGAWLVMLFEQNVKGSNIHGYGDAIWWAVVTVTTVGYGDRFPITPGGRAVAVVLMLIGIGLIGVLTASVASFFVQQHTDDRSDQVDVVHHRLNSRLDEIVARLSRMETALGVVDPDASATATATPPSTDTSAPNDDSPQGEKRKP
jgi:voltage-gated potassium channel